MYASGEIILVVIGILLALQINNWNENRKLQNTNHILLEKLVQEMDLNIERLEYLDTVFTQVPGQSRLDRVIQNCDTALVYLNSGLDTMKLKWLLENELNMTHSYNLHSSVYQEMISTGRLYSLGSDSLIQAIQRYYRKLDREEAYLYERQAQTSAYWQDCKLGFGDLQLDYRMQGREAFLGKTWMFQTESDHYLELKAAVEISLRTVRFNKSRMLEQINESNHLKSLLEDRLRELQ